MYGTPLVIQTTPFTLEQHSPIGPMTLQLQDKETKEKDKT